jgi:hypothetical protein
MNQRSHSLPNLTPALLSKQLRSPESAYNNPLGTSTIETMPEAAIVS